MRCFLAATVVALAVSIVYAAGLVPPGEKLVAEYSAGGVDARVYQAGGVAGPVLELDIALPGGTRPEYSALLSWPAPSGGFHNIRIAGAKGPARIPLALFASDARALLRQLNADNRMGHRIGILVLVTAKDPHSNKVIIDAFTVPIDVAYLENGYVYRVSYVVRSGLPLGPAPRSASPTEGGWRSSVLRQWQRPIGAPRWRGRPTRLGGPV